jgi:hypothetical protein
VLGADTVAGLNEHPQGEHNRASSSAPCVSFGRCRGFVSASCGEQEIRCRQFPRDKLLIPAYRVTLRMEGL